MSMTPETRVRSYQNTFDNFVRDRGIDEDDKYWSAADAAAWQKKVSWMESMGIIESDLPIQ